MAVSIELFSVVVLKQVIEQKYDSGLTQYIADCPNKFYQEDEYLTMVGFMSQEPLNKYCENLISNDFHFDNDLNSSTYFCCCSKIL